MTEYGVDRLIDDIWSFEVDTHIHSCTVPKNLKNLRIMKDDYKYNAILILSLFLKE